MIDPIGVCASGDKRVLTLSVGSDNFSVTKVGRKHFGSLNNRTILSWKSERDLERSIPVVSEVAVNLCVRNNQRKIGYKHGRDYSEMLSKVLNHIQEKPFQAEVFVLDAVPDAIQENTPKMANMSDCSKYVSSAVKNMQETRNSSSILLKTSLNKKMWGSKEVSAILSKIRDEAIEINNDMLPVDEKMERLSDRIVFLKKLMQTPGCEQKALETAGIVINDFSAMKSCISALLKSLYPLYIIDRTFRQHTGYPATWFIMSSTLMDFMYGFENLIGNAINAATAEANAIEPLLAWKIRTTGDE